MTQLGFFTSVWDDSIQITTPCEVNMETREISNIRSTDPGNVSCLTEEYVETFDGTRFPVAEKFPEDGRLYIRAGAEADELVPIEKEANYFWY